MSQAAHRLFHGVAEYLTPVLNVSMFKERGVLTPEEFVAAGDQLVYKCPTWTWERGDPAKAKSYLPADKQYLVTRNVPCRRRVAALETDYAAETEVESANPGQDDAWLATHATSQGAERTDSTEELEDISSGTVGAMQGGGAGEAEGATIFSFSPGGGDFSSVIKDGHFEEGGEGTGARSGGAQGEDDEYVDMEDFEETGIAGADEATLQPAPPAFLSAQEPEDGLVYVRTYDLSISYDKYYQTPRVWLFGYDENRQPLVQEQVFEDIMQDYANRTVTMETHPHLNVTQASIHPCQHAAVMKRIVSQLSQGAGEGEGEGRDATKQEPRIDQYLFIFLKFIQSVVPTMDYDHTMEVSGF